MYTRQEAAILQLCPIQRTPCILCFLILAIHFQFLFNLFPIWSHAACNGSGFWPEMNMCKMLTERFSMCRPLFNTYRFMLWCLSFYTGEFAACIVHIRPAPALSMLDYSDFISSKPVRRLQCKEKDNTGGLKKVTKLKLIPLTDFFLTQLHHNGGGCQSGWHWSRRTVFWHETR